MTKAAKQYGVPRETIRRHVRDEGGDLHLPGGDCLLTDMEEEAIVGYIQYYARHNFPLTRQDLRGVVLVSV